MFNNFFQKAKKEVEYFVALSISSDIIGAAVFTTHEGKTQVFGTAIEKYSGDLTELLEVADLAISKAAGDIPLSNIKKIIFGFPPSFLDGDNISREKLPYLKKLTTELELTPSGFVVIPEAINFYLEDKGGGPQTSILVGVGQKELTVSLFRGGKLTEQTILDRTSLITNDIKEALEKFKEVEIFPSKIILYDGGDLESFKDELLKYPWQENNKFLHFPKIETLAKETVLTSVIEAAAFELNKIPPEDFTKERVSPTLPKKVDADDLGFFKEEEKTLSLERPTEERSTEQKFKFSLPKFSFPWFWKSTEKKYQREEEAEQRGFSQLFSVIRKKKIIFAIIIFLFLLGGFLFISYQLPRATLTLIVDPKIFEEEKEVKVNSDISTVSEATNEIPGKILTCEVSGNKTIPTTGKKIIGEEAKGTVTIYNKTGTSRIFEKGTKISAKNLTFVLNDKIEVPAASESAEGVSFGKAKIGVTATKIGTEGNLPAQTEFVIADFSTSSYSARNEQAFAGGTSREVNSASASDQENLLSSLTSELKEQAKKELTGKLVSGEKLIEESLISEVISRKFSHEVDQETKELSLDLKLRYQGLIYQEKDLSSLLEKMVKSNLPDGYEYQSDETSTQINQAKIKEGEKIAYLKVSFTAKLFPKIDIEKIKREIVGLPVGEIQSYLKTTQQVVGYEIDFKTPFSLFQNNLPKNSKNIKIEVKGR